MKQLETPQTVNFKRKLNVKENTINNIVVGYRVLWCFKCGIVKSRPDWDTPETSITVTMDGTTNVALPSLVIINRMQVVTKGAASGPNAGIIKATADTDGTISSQIRVG